MRTERQKLGAAGEAAAAKYLTKKGMRVLEKNYQSPLGEIDLILLDGEVLVFCEVKTREREGEISAKESVRPNQQRRYRLSAEGYIRRKKAQGLRVRFDIVEVYGTEKFEIRHIPDAF